MMPMVLHVPPKHFHLEATFGCPICDKATHMQDAVEYEGFVNQSGNEWKWGCAVFCSLECLLTILSPWGFT